jgi:hypothetical protein
MNSINSQGLFCIYTVQGCPSFFVRRRPPTPSHIPPERPLGNQRPVAQLEGIGQVVVGKDDEKIGSRTIPPLHPQVEIDVARLAVELHEIGEKKFVTQRQVNPGANQPKIPLAVLQLKG